MQIPHSLDDGLVKKQTFGWLSAVVQHQPHEFRVVLHDGHRERISYVAEGSTANRWVGDKKLHVDLGAGIYCMKKNLIRKVRGESRGRVLQQKFHDGRVLVVDCPDEYLLKERCIALERVGMKLLDLVQIAVSASSEK